MITQIIISLDCFFMKGIIGNALQSIAALVLEYDNLIEE
jgi:hypothetical protein